MKKVNCTSAYSLKRSSVNKQMNVKFSE